MKVRITQDDPVPEYTNYFVLSPTGDYDSTDLIECYLTEAPSVSVGAFQAQYVKFGSVVYRDAEYEALLKELNIISETKEPTLDEAVASNTAVITEVPQ